MNNNALRYALTITMLFVASVAFTFSAPSDIDITGVYKTAGTTRISNTGVGTFASGTTIAGNNICLESGSGCPVGAITPTSGWVNNSGSGNISMANNNANVSANTLFIDNTNGRVGIGTTSPRTKLDITGGTAYTNAIRVEGYTTPGTGEGLELGYDSGVGYVTAYSRTGTIYLPLSLRGDNIIFQDDTLEFARITGANMGIGTTGPTAKVQINSSASAGSLYVHNTTGSNHFFINGATGRVGIGTVSPASGLHLTIDALTLDTTGSEGGELRIYNTTGGSEWFIDDTTGFLRIRHRDYATMMVFNRGNGYVGIGTDTPLSSLHSVGNITATAFNATGVGSNDVTGYCLAYGPAGCALRQNTTCTWTISPNGATKNMACN